MSRAFFSQPAQEWLSPQPEQPAQQPLPCRRRHIAQAIPPATAAAARIRMTTSAAVIRSSPYITIIIPLLEKDIHGFSERKSVPASVILLAVPGNRLPPPEKRPQTPEPPKGGADKGLERRGPPALSGERRRRGPYHMKKKGGTGHEVCPRREIQACCRAGRSRKSRAGVQKVGKEAPTGSPAVAGALRGAGIIRPPPAGLYIRRRRPALSAGPYGAG